MTHDSDIRPAKTSIPRLAGTVAIAIFAVIAIAAEWRWRTSELGAEYLSIGVLFLLPALLLSLPLRSRLLAFTIVIAGLLPIVAVSTPLATRIASTLERLVLLGLIAELGHRWLRSRDEVRRVADRDALTGVLNNIGLRRRLEEECGRVDRGGSPFSLLMLDCDDFKSLNDEHGHTVGDHCLQRIARNLVESTRLYDVVGRMGGDEFAVLLPGTDAVSAETITDRIRAALEAVVEQEDWEIGFSLGTATFESVPESVDAALAEADRRMYEAKHRRSSAEAP